MDHIWVQYPETDKVVCQTCGKTKTQAAKTCYGPEGVKPTPSPDLSNGK